MPDSMSYFVGKYCTISTVQINFRFKEEPMIDYFSGIIESANCDGIVMVHPTTMTKNYIRLEHIVGIHEEQVLYENNPEHAKVIEEFRKRKPEEAEKRKIPAVQTPYVDPKALQEMAKKAKQTYQP
jgi:hypothetical protein